MENTENSALDNANPKKDGQDKETKGLPKHAITNEKNEGFSGEAPSFNTGKESNDHFLGIGSYEIPNKGDQPGDENKTLPDSNAPIAPENAV